MNIGIDKNMRILSNELKSRGFHVVEIDYGVNGKLNQNNSEGNRNVEKTDVYIYYEDAFRANYHSSVKNEMLNNFIPTENGALLINACNKTVEQILYIIEARVYSPLFEEKNSSLI